MTRTRFNQALRDWLNDTYTDELNAGETIGMLEASTWPHGPHNLRERLSAVLDQPRRHDMNDSDIQYHFGRMRGVLTYIDEHNIPSPYES